MEAGVERSRLARAGSPLPPEALAGNYRRAGALAVRRAGTPAWEVGAGTPWVLS